MEGRQDDGQQINWEERKAQLDVQARALTHGMTSVILLLHTDRSDGMKDT